MSIQMAFLHQALSEKWENGQTPTKCQGRRSLGNGGNTAAAGDQIPPSATFAPVTPSNPKLQDTSRVPCRFGGMRQREASPLFSLAVCLLPAWGSLLPGEGCCSPRRSLHLPEFGPSLGAHHWTGAVKSCLEPEKKPEGSELSIQITSIWWCCLCCRMKKRLFSFQAGCGNYQR